MRLNASIYFAALALAALGASAIHAKTSWRVIAQQTVGKGGDTDTVRVSNRQKFGQVRLCVYGRNIRLNNFLVQFGNGRRQSMELKSVFRAGQCSRAVDLMGERRHIEFVTLNYRRLPGDGSPIVRIQAR
jgi:hypothetical protein